MKPLRLLALCVATVMLSACGGGGGGGGPAPAPTPTATLTANPTSVVAGATTTLTWSSANANACAASGGWSGVKATSGTETSAALTAETTFTLSCGSAVVNATVTVTQPATVSVSGQLLVPSSTQTDSDTNDIVLTPVPNNTPATAQALPNPVMVGGYVNKPGAGESGPLQAAGDVDDYYRVSLLEGQVIELTVANPDPVNDDLDLALCLSGACEQSTGQSRVEQLTVPSTGEYVVHVTAYSGASNYILSIGLNATSAPTLSTDREFVPGEVLVKMRDNVAAQLKPQAALTALDMKIVKTTPGSHSLVKLGMTSEALEKLRPGLSAKIDGTRYANESQRQKALTLYALKELRKRTDIAWAEPNWILHASADSSEPLYERQRWHYEAMQLPSAWDVTTGSASVVVAVVDSGVRSHAEFANRVVNPYDFVDDDTDASDPGVSAQGNYYFHGTHVAGTIGANGTNSSGGTGVAWTVSMMPVRVLGANGSGTFDDILNGVLYAARLSNSSGRVPAKRADVINLSLGALGSCPQGAQDVFNAARQAGSIIVAAAGNENTSQPSTPAVCNGVISVSALDARRQRAPYSNYGDSVDVAAPGGDTSADRNGDGYSDGIYSAHSTRSAAGAYSDAFTYMQGTSMAAPHVAGVFALMRAVNPNLTPAQIDTLLANGALTDDIGVAGRDSLGIGAINAFKAVRAAGGGLTPPAQQLDVAPSSLNLGVAGTDGEVVVSNGGSAALAVTGTIVSVPWLSVAPVAVDANGLGRYRITANRAALANGVYRGTVEFRAGAAPSVLVSVVLQVGNTSSESDAGQHYLLLVEPSSGEAKYQTEVLARGSAVNFNFPAVVPGQYQLSVGTDLNNDGFICDDGEACGQYPVYGEPRIITVGSAVSGLVVTTNYRTDVAPASTQASSAISNSAKRRLR